ncbi:hypothetical protein ACKVWC_011365 [Pyricularia oryzae]
MPVQIWLPPTPTSPTLSKRNTVPNGPCIGHLHDRRRRKQAIPPSPVVSKTPPRLLPVPTSPPPAPCRRVRKRTGDALDEAETGSISGGGCAGRLPPSTAPALKQRRVDRILLFGQTRLPLKPTPLGTPIPLSALTEDIATTGVTEDPLLARNNGEH